MDGEDREEVRLPHIGEVTPESVLKDLRSIAAIDNLMGGYKVELKGLVRNIDGEDTTVGVDNLDRIITYSELHSQIKPDFVDEVIIRIDKKYGTDVWEDKLPPTAVADVLFNERYEGVESPWDLFQASSNDREG
jgi:hypothetical protein